MSNYNSNVYAVDILYLTIDTCCISITSKYNPWLTSFIISISKYIFSPIFILTSYSNILCIR